MSTGPVTIHMNVVCPAYQLNRWAGLAYVELALSLAEQAGTPFVKATGMWIAQDGSPYTVHSILQVDTRVIVGNSLWTNRTLGRLEPLDPTALAAVAAHTKMQLGAYGWIWRLDLEDLALAEGVRGADGSIQAEIEWDGLAVLKPTAEPEASGEVARLYGNGRVVLTAEEWAGFAGTVGLVSDRLPITLNAASVHDSWRRAKDVLQRADLRLRQGDAVGSLTDCFDVLSHVLETDGVRPLIYRPEKWKEFWKAREEPDERLLKDGFGDRLKALTDLFCALGQVANVFGHHGAQTGGLEGELTSKGFRQPLDQWEAEVLVAMEFLGVAYLMRRLAEARSSS